MTTHATNGKRFLKIVFKFHQNCIPVDIYIVNLKQLVMLKLTLTKSILLVTFMSSYTSSKHCTKYKCERNRGGLLIGHFSGYVIADRFFNDTNQTHFNASKEKECVKKCVRIDACRTITVVALNNSRVTCYLSNNSVTKKNILADKDSKIISLGPPVCQNSPCKNGGTCQVDYHNGQYVSECCPDWTGKDCSLPVLSPPNVTLSFDEYTVTPKFNVVNPSFKFKLVSTTGGTVSVHHAKSVVYNAKLSESGALKFNMDQMTFLANPL